MNFFVLSAFVAVSFVAARNVTLADVYGPAPVVEAMEPWSQRSSTRQARSESYFATRDASSCTFPLEVYIVQDSTDSFEGNFEEMKNTQLPLMVSALKETHPNSVFGISSFRDKPIWSLGDEGDYCFHFEAEMSADVGVVHHVYANVLQSYGGGDPSENSFGAIQAVAQSNTPGWSNPDATRLIVMVTDAPPHFQGDGFQKPEYNMVDFSGRFDEAHMDTQCLAEYYPSPDHVRDAIYAREAYAAFLVFDGDYWNELPTNSWKWFNSYIGQTDEFVGDLGESSRQFWPSLAKVIREIELVECGIMTTEEEISTHESSAPQEITTTDEASFDETISTDELEFTSLTTSEECTPCPDPCLPCDEDCPPCHNECGCAEVEIRLLHKPLHLHLEVQN